MSSYHNDPNPEWRQASKSENCPICKKPNWCSITGATGDPEAAVCMRVESDNKRPNGGWHHRLKEREKRPSNGAVKPSLTSTSLSKSKPKRAHTSPKVAIASLERKLGKHSAQWTYHNASGTPIGVIVRWDKRDGKEIRPITRNEPTDGGFSTWQIAGMPIPRPLYQLPSLADAEQVIVVEGEKCADALRALGYVATTSPHGSKGAGMADWSPLAGKQVVLMPDIDEPGNEYIDAVVGLLEHVSPAPTVRVLRLDSLPDRSPMPEGGDVVDWLAAGGTKELLARMLESAEEWKASSQVWPELQPFDQDALPEFPTEVLPPVLREFVEAESLATQTPADLAGLLVLAVCGACIARRVEVVIPEHDWREPINLFVTVLLESGNRKSAVFADAVKPLREIEAERIEAARPAVARAASEARANGARLRDLEKRAARNADVESLHEATELAAELALMPKVVSPRLIVDDATSEKLTMMLSDQGGRLASMSPEGGVFDLMAGMYSKSGMPQFGTYLMGHSGEDLIVSRVSREEVSVKSPALTCAYAMQPQVIDGLAENAAFRGRGLLARFLYALPISWVGSREIGPPPVPEATRTAYRHVVRELSDFDGDYKLGLSPAACRRLLEWEAEIEQMLGDGGEMEILKDWGSKLAGATLRLAAIMHCVEHGVAGNIGIETLEDAIELARYAIPHAEVVLNKMGGTDDKQDADARYILKWIERNSHATFTKRDAQQHGKRRFPKATDIDLPLGVLVERGYIREQKTVANGPGRPASPVYKVNPLLHGPRAEHTDISQSRPQYSQKPAAELQADNSGNIESASGDTENGPRERFTV